MLTVTGTAEFSEDRQKLNLKVQIQPHFTNEHDCLDKVTLDDAVMNLQMEQGQLVLAASLDVPLPIPLPSTGPGSEQNPEEQLSESTPE